MKAVCVLATLSAASAFVAPQMKVDGGLSRVEFAKVAAAAVVGASAPAWAAKGEGPKQNVYGFGAEMGLGGGMSTPYPEVETYSPYSPYANTGKGLYVQGDEQLKRRIEILKDCQKRFEKVPGWIGSGKWEEIRAELTRKAYDLRNAMNTLSAGKPEAEAAAKAYYRDLEEITVSARRKQAASAQAAYEKSVADLSKYLSLL